MVKERGKRSEKTGGSWSFLLPLLEVDSLCLSREENHHDMNQTMDIKTSSRPEKERPTPLNTPALPSRPHGRGLGIEGAELMDSIRTLISQKNLRMSFMKSLLTTWKKC